MADITITFPNNDETFMYRTVVVHGKGTFLESSDLRGELQKGTDPVIPHTRRRLGKGHWSLVFKRVKIDQPYTLTVKATGFTDATKTGIKVVRTSRRMDPKNIITPRFVVLNIEEPLEDADLENPFLVWGTTDEVAQPSASVSATNYTVQFLYGPPDNPVYWAFEFSQVTAPGDWTLIVEAGQSSQQRLIHMK